jgi:hypothetical protein
MKTHDLRTAVPASAKDTALKRLKKSEKNTARDVLKEICPFTVEPFSVCPTKGIVGGNTLCPFSLEVCIQQQTTGYRP